MKRLALIMAVVAVLPAGTWWLAKNPHLQLFGDLVASVDNGIIKVRLRTDK